ncbi:MAG TPA: hypothetical protein VK501_16600 [Baekduia sp.]|uniref:hypothetical protein n=1 Tax=Baekduia sp. TaxID=2600305 RepID=UPI002BCA1D51|nr:hypothetical protein [Baekduia sp.]HMJ35530.1 hypothetical protein [Baekduia sp.]
MLDQAYVSFGGTLVHDLRMTGQLNLGTGVVAPVAERMVVHAALETFTAVKIQTGTLRDSVATNDLAGGVAVLASGVVAPAEVMTVENVTAIATGADSTGLLARTDGLYPGDTLRPTAVAVRNSIMRGTANDVAASTSDFFTHPGRLDLSVATSNFRTSYAHNLAGGALVLGEGNQTGAGQTDAAAVFAPGDPDYHQRLGSPTIDAGVPDPATGTGDIDGDARISEGGLDIGADEMLAAPALTGVGATATATDAAWFTAAVTGGGTLSVAFEAGPSDAYGTALPATPDGAGVFGALGGGFPAGGLLHYRAVATATNGPQTRTTSGPDAVLQLPGAAAPPVSDPPAPLPVPPAIAPAPPVKAASPAPLKATSIIKLPTGSTKTCSSRRTLTLRLAAPAGTKITKVVVKVAGKAKTYKGKDVKPKVDLRGLPKGKYSVKVSITLADGRTATLTKAYKTCAAKKRGRGK